MIRKTLVTAMMLAFCGSVGAAGLGRINVLSSLGQPLRAEIELNASTEELEGMVVRMASAEAYKRANVEYPAALVGLKMAVEKRGAQSVVRLASDKAIGEPFVDLLIDLSWAGGRLQREYTFLLDPAETSGPKPIVAATEPVSHPVASGLAPKVTPGAGVKPASGERVMAEEHVRKEPESRGTSDYTVQRGDSLAKIATALNPGEVSQEQMVAALYRANSEAFIGGNINRLRAGRILKVPQAGEVAQIRKGEAHRIILKASNFDAYRQTVAAAAAAAPAKETGSGQAASGKIAPKVEEQVAPSQQAKDKVKVTAAETGKAAATDVANKARLQALQDDIASRDKALKEANSRVADLEKNVKELQRLIELKNQSLAEAQKQAAAAKTAEKDKNGSKDAGKAPTKPVVEASVPVVETQSAAAAASSVAASTEASVPVAEQSLPEASAPAVVQASAPAAAKSAAPQSQPEEEGGLFSNLWALLGIAAAVGGVGYVVIKQRRKQAAAGTGNTQLSESSTTSPNSVFGNAGGQTVDTGGTSLLHTDFSQSGMSAIDADEGVDPVAEADVYMAYGRDAQAEEILLDALKSDPARTAVYVKLLEIYAQRKSLKQFENVATDLYTQTGGAGEDWSRAAALGVTLDPDNPLYRSAAGGVKAEIPALPESSGSEVSESVELPAEEPAAAAEPVASDAAVSFGTNNISQSRSTWTVPGEIGQFTTEGSMPVLAEQPAAEPAPVPEALNLDFNLDLDAPSTEDQPTQIESREGDDLPAMNEAVETQPSIAAEEEAPLEFDIGLDEVDAAATAGVETPMQAAAPVADLDIGIETGTTRSTVAEVDLEKTNFEGSLLDFDFELGDEDVEKPALDLSSVNLRPVEAPEKVAEVRPSSVEAVSAAPIQDKIDVNDEVSTKLELAKAYEEMGDMEGARELLEEVLSDGADFQKEQAKTMLGRIG